MAAAWLPPSYSFLAAERVFLRDLERRRVGPFFSGAMGRSGDLSSPALPFRAKYCAISIFSAKSDTGKTFAPFFSGKIRDLPVGGHQEDSVFLFRREPLQHVIGLLPGPREYYLDSLELPPFSPGLPCWPPSKTTMIEWPLTLLYRGQVFR